MGGVRASREARACGAEWIAGGGFWQLAAMAEQAIATAHAEAKTM
jgi:hypothetical protein